MKNSRDYKAEYARRIARNLAKGLSRSQARGHRRPKEKPLRPAQVKPIQVGEQRKLERAVRDMRKGQTLKQAAIGERLSTDRLRHYLHRHHLATWSKQRWRFRRDKRDRHMLFYSQGRAEAVRVSNAQASKIGEYLHAVWRFMERNDPAQLAPYVGQGVIDSVGHLHPFETDPNTLYRLASGPPFFDDLYRIES